MKRYCCHVDRLAAEHWKTDRLVEDIVETMNIVAMSPDFGGRIHTILSIYQV